MCIGVFGVTTHLKNTNPSFLPNPNPPPPIKLANCPSSPFLSNPPRFSASPKGGDEIWFDFVNTLYVCTSLQ